MLNNIVTLQSGFPFSIASARDNSFSGIGRDRADYIGGNAALDTGRPHGHRVAPYRNTAMFVPNAIGTFGNSGKNIILKTAVHPRQPRLAPLFTPPRVVLRNHPVGEGRSRCAAQWNWAFRAAPAFPTAGCRIIRGPHYFNVDFGATKRTNIVERVALEFRAEFFNVLNNVMFNAPNSNHASAQFGRITSALDPRIIQFGLKLQF